jgi:hypothetical protein
MKTRSTVFGLAGAALAVGVSTYVFAQSEQGPPFTHHMRAGMMHGTGPGMTGMGHDDAATMAQMSVVHELFLNHDRITRTVTTLPDGVRTVTESDDPRTAQLLKEHVASMRQRVETGRDPGLPIESEALRSIFRNYDKIVTKVETTDKGIIVVQTSTDPGTVSALQQHASEVTDFVTEGMVAMRNAMMKNGGGMMPRGMQGSMPRRAPNGGTAQGGR